MAVASYLISKGHTVDYAVNRNFYEKILILATMDLEAEREVNIFGAG